MTLTAVATVSAGDELLWPLVAVLLLGSEAETADGDGLCHRLEREQGMEERVRTARLNKGKQSNQLPQVD